MALNLHEHPVVSAAPRGMSVKIHRSFVGRGQRVYVIAEAGVNHNGDPETARRMIDAALAAGADAVKFQAFRADRLVTASGETAEYQKGATGINSQRQMLRDLELSADQFAELRRYCSSSGIEFLATPFGDEDLAMLAGLKVAAIKVASTDLNNLPFLERVARTNLPIILSTGASTADELDRTVGCLIEWNCGDRFVLLHCVSSYPTPWKDANLRRIGALAQRFNVPVGYSDHTDSLETGALAVATGACVIEKHFTLDRSLPGPDQAISLEPKALAEYIANIRSAESALGDGSLSPRAVESEVRQMARKSVVAARDIRAGETIDESCLTTKRPVGGIAPDQVTNVLGCRAKTNIAVDSAISWDMLETNDR